ncbi:MAG: hypothetical protein P8078_12275, partial [bacterium]
MKNKKILIIALISVVLGLSGFNNAQAAYYGIYDIRDIGGGVLAPEQYPDTVHFDWVNRSYTYLGQTPDISFSVQFTLYAPTSWDSETYGAYQDETLGDANLYSYYYQVTNTSSTALKAVTIPYLPAEVTEVGSAGSGESTSATDPWGDSIMATFGNSGSGYLTNN